VPRYIKQPVKMSCSPIAIMNAIKWAGGRCTLKDDFCSVNRIAQCSKNGTLGTRVFNFDRALRKKARNLFKVKRHFRPSIQEVETHLSQRGGAVIIEYCWIDIQTPGRRGAHSSLVIEVSDSGRSFVLVNDKPGHAVTRRKRSSVLKYLTARKRNDKRRNYPFVWFLTRIKI